MFDSQVKTDLSKTLQTAVSCLGLQITAMQQQQLLSYLEQLLIWNKAYNLTAIKQPQAALIKHVIDCLAVVTYLKPGSLLDIGTGAGLPGLVVAICQPTRAITVLDSNQKKIRFIKQMISELNLHHVTAVAARVERLQQQTDATMAFEVITSRAFASLDDFVRVGAPLLSQTGCLQAMKGMPPTPSEISALPMRDDRTQAEQGTMWAADVQKIEVPFLAEARHLVTLS